MPILKFSDKKLSCIKFNDELKNLKLLTITSSDTDPDKLEFIAKHCKNLKIVIFENCGQIQYATLDELFHNNQKIKKIMFVNCERFDKDAFKSFERLSKSLKELDLTGYKISNDEIRHLLRSGLKKLQSITFSERCEVSDLFKKYYPDCVIYFVKKQDNEEKMPSSPVAGFETIRFTDYIRRQESPRKLADRYYGDDNYTKRHTLMENLKSSSEKKLYLSYSKKDSRIPRSFSSDNGSNNWKYMDKIPSEDSSSSNDIDYGMRKMSLSSKQCDKHVRRK